MILFSPRSTRLDVGIISVGVFDWLLSLPKSCMLLTLLRRRMVAARMNAGRMVEFVVMRLTPASWPTMAGPSFGLGLAIVGGENRWTGGLPDARLVDAIQLRHEILEVDVVICVVAENELSNVPVTRVSDVEQYSGLTVSLPLLLGIKDPHVQPQLLHLLMARALTEVNEVH